MSELRFAVLNEQPEIFYTVQGEGRSLGEPAVFARLSNCNLQCTWCDTPYTWNWTGTPYEHEDSVKYDKEQEQMLVSVGQAVDQITGFSCERVVITGGEPMMQQRGILEMVTALRANNPNFWFEIETNGTIPPTRELAAAVNQFNVSPKLANSGNREKKRNKPNALAAFAALPHADFKFVVTGEEDMAEIFEIIAAHNIPHDRVFLMPEGRNEATITARQRELVEVCKQHNFNLTTRLHVLLWGAKKGV